MRGLIIAALTALNRLYCRTVFRVSVLTRDPCIPRTDRRDPCIPRTDRRDPCIPRTDRRIPLPASGPAIIVANHTSGVDPLLLASVSKRPIRFLMAAEYYELPILRRLFRLAGAIPVRRDGRDVLGARVAMEALRAGDCIGIFPRGGIGTEGPMKHGAVVLAAHAGAPIVPAFIAGGPPGFQVFGAFFRPARVRIAFGEPIRIGADRRLSREAIERATAAVEQALRALAG